MRNCCGAVALPRCSSFAFLLILMSFGSTKRRPRLHPAENFLLVVVAVHLCFLPWALGTMHVWSQSVSLALAAFSFSVALWPRIYKEEFSRNGRSFRLVVRHRLLTFPIFWIGAIFLCYVLVQALNPAWRRVADARYSWLVALSHAKWLPHGMETPFGMASPWRSLLVYGSAWMTACAVWVGFTRRKTLQILFTILAINAFALAALGIA